MPTMDNKIMNKKRSCRKLLNFKLPHDKSRQTLFTNRNYINGKASSIIHILHVAILTKEQG